MPRLRPLRGASGQPASGQSRYCLLALLLTTEVMLTGVSFQAHEIVALEILFLLLQNATDDSVEVAVAFLQEVGQKLGELSPKAVVGE